MSAANRLKEEQRRKEIMDSAAKVILKKGFEKTTMEEIIAGTTLSKGGVYHYYGSVIEIFKDIMLYGIEYRNTIIKDHLMESKKEVTEDFMEKEIVEKIIDDIHYLRIYVEFLIAKKRNPKLNELMLKLEKETKENFKLLLGDAPSWLFNEDTFKFITEFINGMIFASDSLNARDNFKKNRKLLENMIALIFENAKDLEK